VRLNANLDQALNKREVTTAGAVLAEHEPQPEALMFSGTKSHAVARVTLRLGAVRIELASVVAEDLL